MKVGETLAADSDRTLLEKLNLIRNVMMHIDDASRTRKGDDIKTGVSFFFL